MPGLRLHAALKKQRAKLALSPFFWGPFSECNTGVPQWRGLVETLNKLLVSHCLVMPVSSVFVSLSYVALKGSFFV